MNQANTVFAFCLVLSGLAAARDPFPPAADRLADRELRGSVLPQIRIMNGMVLRYSEAILRSLASQPSVRKKEIEPNAREELLRLQVEEQYLEYLESSVNIRLCDVELACFSSLRRHYLSAIEGQRKLTDELSRLKPDKLSILGSALAIYGEVRAADEEEVVMYRVIPVDEREIYAVYQPFAPAAPDSGDAGFGPETAGRGNSLAHHDGKDSISALHQHRISRIVMVPAP